MSQRVSGPLRASQRLNGAGRLRRQLITTLLGLLLLATAQAAEKKPPNILFVILDDVGIDQMETFGFGGDTPPSMPTIAAIAESGVRFRNTWAMPACSTSRAVMFTGRYPLRTQVYGALGPDDLSNSMVSPFETTVPVLLRQRGYKSALFGKFHLGLQDNNPFHEAMPRALGWDYFFGFLDETGDPSSIDTTAGSGDAETGGPYTCGFVPGARQGGTDRGACYDGSGGCRQMQLQGGIPPGRACRDEGGILDPDSACQAEMPAGVAEGFNNLSAHSVSPLVINEESGQVVMVPPTDIRARTYRGSSQVDAAIDWIERQPSKQPWMVSLSFSTAHTPVMQPPQHLLTSDPQLTSELNCDSADVAAQRVLTNLMLEALDSELARLMLAAGITERDLNGGIRFNAGNTETMIVIVGDNGTLGTAVKSPFEPTRAKGTAYQTGVWVPLIVAGPLVNRAGRSVKHMVNIADLYQLFGEIAGIDVAGNTPATIDAMPMLAYLRNPRQHGIRSFNFTQVGLNTQANGAINGPCTIGTGCSHIPVTKSVCEDNGGSWWGEGADDPITEGIPQPGGLQHCCEVNQFLYAEGQPLFKLDPIDSVAVRNERYKIVWNSHRGDPEPDENSAEPPSCDVQVTEEFYAIDERLPEPRLDRAELDLLDQPTLTPQQRANHAALTAELLRILDSQPPCLGDGNIDRVVDELDQDDWSDFMALANGASSWFDVDQDGYTGTSDLAVITSLLGTRCEAPEFVSTQEPKRMRTRTRH